MKTIKCRDLEPGMWFTIDGETTFVVESVNSLGWGKYSIEFRSKGRPGQWAVHRDVKVSGSDSVILLEPTKQEIFDEGYAYHKETAKLLSYLSGDLNKIMAEFSEEEQEQKSVVEPPKNYDLDFLDRLEKDPPPPKKKSPQKGPPKNDEGSVTSYGG